MYAKRLTRFSLALVLATLLAGVASAQSRIESKPFRGLQSSGSADFGSIASGQSLVVTKTAYLNGQDICGQIRIFNFSGFPANVVSIVDWLEVHFPNNVPPPGLVTGSDLNWFKVADVPIGLPAPIPPFVTLNINYCHPLCETADHPRADYMRNVVRVSISTPYGQTRTFPARSGNVRPPTLDCRACCLPDGPCVRTTPARCTSLGGTQRGPQSLCSATTCLEACCVSANQCLALTAHDCTTSASGTPQGLDTDCATTECCTLLGHEDCAQQDDCCDDSAFCQIVGGVSTCCVLKGESGCGEDSHCCNPIDILQSICDQGKCCGRTGGFGPGFCFDDDDCCDENAFCQFSGVGQSKCCIQRGDTGCDDDGDCCNPDGLLLGVCESGKCCGRTGAFGPGLCFDDDDCCDENAFCQFSGVGQSKCCIQRGDTGCDDDGDCCNPDSLLLGVCESGKCCGRTGHFGPGLCFDDNDCCDENAFCEINGTQSKCCIPRGISGCDDKSDCCGSDNSAVTCSAGTCCAPTGALGACFADSHCCDGNAVCSGTTCCLPQFRSGCTTDADCCSGLVCDFGTCDSVAAP